MFLTNVFMERAIRLILIRCYAAQHETRYTKNSCEVSGSFYSKGNLMKRLMLVSLCALTFGLGSTQNVSACCACWSATEQEVVTVLKPIVTFAGQLVEGTALALIQAAATNLQQTGGAVWADLVQASQTGKPLSAASIKDLEPLRVIVDNDGTVDSVVAKVVLQLYATEQQLKASASTSAASSSAMPMAVVPSNKA